MRPTVTCTLFSCNIFFFKIVANELCKKTASSYIMGFIKVIVRSSVLHLVASRGVVADCKYVNTPHFVLVIFIVVVVVLLAYVVPNLQPRCIPCCSRPHRSREAGSRITFADSCLMP